MKKLLIGLLIFFLAGCNSTEDLPDVVDENPDLDVPESDVYYIPVVIHVIHNGEKIGEGSNLSEDRILDQIESLNDDSEEERGH